MLLLLSTSARVSSRALGWCGGGRWRVLLPSVPSHGRRLLCAAAGSSGAHVVDVRSDTLTKPSQAMKKAMMEAELGDDVYREDPTVLELETKVANLLGKESSLFVPSGTMGNLISVMAHCDRRDSEVLLGDLSHIFYYEQGGLSQLGGIHPRTLRTNPDGTFDLDEIVRKVRTDNVHEPVTKLLCLENTHNKCGGTVLPMKYIDQLGALKQSISLPVHLDGARLFNAAIALEVSVADLAKHCDSVSICLSKGLGTPVGSIIAGTNTFFNKALRLRKVFGGGMRQVGILAAAGIYALDNMVNRLSEDHRHARMIAEAIQALNSDKATVNMETIQTNIVIIHLSPSFLNSKRFCQRLNDVTKEEQEDLGESIIVKMYPFELYQVRMVLHCDVNKEDVHKIIKKLKYVITKERSRK